MTHSVTVIGVGSLNFKGDNKGRRSKFRVGSRVRQTPEEGRNFVSITIKMKTIVRKPLMIKKKLYRHFKRKTSKI